MRTFYHGTTDLFPIKKVLLPPVMTDIKREDWRKKYTDKVFFTSSILSASIIYIVKPIGQYFNTINTEYIADKALILDKSPTV